MNYQDYQRVFRINGYWQDSPNDDVNGYLVTNCHGTPKGYRDEDIFFYGLSEADLIEAVEGKQAIEDFVITDYEVIE